MKYEERIIISTFLAGLSDFSIGVIFALTGWHTWWFNHFHLFGALGFGMVSYAGWHWFFYVRSKKSLKSSKRNIK